MGGPLSSETMILNTYLQSEGSQAAKNIIQICRTFEIEDGIIFDLIQSFDSYKEECYVNAGSLEEAQIQPLLKAYKALSKAEQNKITVELQFELLSEKNTTVTKFNHFISLLNAYPDFFKAHQNHTVEVQRLIQKTKDKIIYKPLQAELEEFIYAKLSSYSTLVEKEAWLAQINTNLKNVNEKQDFLAAFFVSPFLSFSEISLRIKASLAKLELSDGCDAILQSLITVNLATLARELSNSKPQFQEKTWREAQDIYQRAQALAQPHSEAFQALLKKAQETEAKEQKELNDLERSRNYIIRYELQGPANFNEVLNALKACVGWQDSWSFGNKKKSLQLQIETVNHCVICKKENPNLNIVDYFIKTGLGTSYLSDKPSIPESFFETLPSEPEHFESAAKTSLLQNLKHYGPMLATGIAAFGVGFYSLPWMVCVLAVGTFVSLHYQEESFPFQDKKIPQRPKDKSVPVSDLEPLRNNLAVAPTLTPANTLAAQAEKPSVSEQPLENVEVSKIRAQRLKIFAK